MVKQQRVGAPTEIRHNKCLVKRPRDHRAIASKECQCLMDMNNVKGIKRLPQPPGHRSHWVADRILIGENRDRHAAVGKRVIPVANRKHRLRQGKPQRGSGFPQRPGDVGNITLTAPDQLVLREIRGRHVGDTQPGLRRTRHSRQHHVLQSLKHSVLLV